jgi:DNA-binding MurR/RpiR family transcriptional regulator
MADQNSKAPQDFESLKTYLAERHPDLPKRLKQAASFAVDHPDEMAFDTAVVIAERAGVQPSTLVRLAQAIGYAGFSEMQEVFQVRLKEGRPDYHRRLEALKAQSGDARAITHLAGFSEAAIVSIERLRATADPERLDAAIDLLAKADTIYLVGARRVFPVAVYLAYAFGNMGIRCQLVDHIGQMGAEQLACARPNDAVLSLSFTPYAQPTVDLAKAAAKAGIPQVAITDSAFSPLVSTATVWIEVAEADYGAFRSLSATFALAMTLAVAIEEKREKPAA